MEVCFDVVGISASQPVMALAVFPYFSILSSNTQFSRCLPTSGAIDTQYVPSTIQGTMTQDETRKRKVDLAIGVTRFSGQL